MDDGTFDRLTVWLGRLVTRRATIGALGVLALPGLAEARKKRKRKKHKRKKHRKVVLNDFGCVNVGGFCKTGQQCCSGICQGKKGKNLRTCRTHHLGGCQADQDVCQDEDGIACPDNPAATCFRTTGQGSFCGLGIGGQCTACANDADCVAIVGTGAACVICAGCPGVQDTGCIPPGV